MVVNGQLERPIGTVLLEFEVTDFQIQENFIVMKTLPNPLIGLCFLQRHNALSDIRQGIITFPMQLRTEHATNTRVAPPYLRPPTWRSSCNLKQKAPFNRPQYCDSVFTYGGT